MATLSFCMHLLAHATSFGHSSWECGWTSFNLRLELFTWFSCFWVWGIYTCALLVCQKWNMEVCVWVWGIWKHFAFFLLLTASTNRRTFFCLRFVKAVRSKKNANASTVSTNRRTFFCLRFVEAVRKIKGVVEGIMGYEIF